MRLIGSLIKYLIYLLIILVAVSASLFYFNTGSWLIKPLAERAGGFFLSPMTLNINSLEGSAREGFVLDGLSLSSGDGELFTLSHLSVSPDWDMVLSGMNGLPFIKSLNVHGVSSDLDSVMTIVNHFATSDDNSTDDEEPEDDDKDPSPLHINPFELSITDVNFSTPYAALSLDALTLTPEGLFTLDSHLTSRDNTLPLKANARINFEPLEVASSELFIGEKGTGKLTAKLEPLAANLWLTALSLDEFMKFAPPLGVKASGRIDAKLSAQTENDNLKASGVLSMPRANIMDVPLNFRLPFTWDGVSVFALNGATASTKAASLSLNTSADIASMNIKADGEALNISLREIGQMFAPEAGLDGEGGNVRFDVDTTVSGDVFRDILPGTRANVNLSVPQITAAGVRILKGLAGQVKLSPGQAPRLDLNGEIFKGKLFARGEAQTSNGDIKPSAVISLVNIDIPTIINTFPAVARSVEKPLGKVSARAVINDDLNVDGTIKSDKLGAFGVTLTNILANLSYNHQKGTADLEKLSMNLGKGYLSASANANLNSERFSFRTDARNIEPRVIPMLRDVKGVYTLSSQGSGKYTDINSINVEADLAARNAGYSDYTIGNVNIPVDFAHSVVKVNDGVISLPKGTITLNGNANLNTSAFSFSANAQNVEPRYMKALKDLAGTYNLTANASGNYANISTIKAAAKLNARNVGYSGMTFGNVEVPVTFANNLVNIPGARAALPGGSIGLKGSVNIANTSNPLISLSASTAGINLAEVMEKFSLQNDDIPITGKVWGNVNINGPLNRANVNATLRAANVKAGELADIPGALLDVSGNTQKVNVKKLEATLNGANIIGSGSMSINQKDIMKSALNVNTRFSRLDLKKLLTQFTGSAPVTGMLRGDIALNGTIEKPALDVALKSPVIYDSTEVHDIAVKLRAPEANHYTVNAKARIDTFKPEADVDLRNSGGVWSYNVKTKPLDIDKAIRTQMPDMAGMAKGNLTVSVKGSTKPNSDINVNASVPNLKLMDKIDVKNISLPLTYSQAKNKAELKNASALLSNGEIKTGFEYDVNKASWKGNVKVLHLDFGSLANKFLPEGELVGSIDAEVSAKGSQGLMNTSFANGKFSTSPGYFHKMSLIDTISPTKRISFENISGTFFWNGSDVFLNPGTGARAGSDEPLYRYVNVNGALGVPGKGLKLVCDGRFDLKILDQLLGAMKGVFQYMTGSLGRDVLKDAAGRVLGVKKRDFQNVSFTLANSWNEPQLLNLKITKAIEDFLPIDILNHDSEAQRDDTQFKLNLKIPVGPGNKSVEEESTGDQMKEQIIDNLFNWGL